MSVSKKSNTARRIIDAAMTVVLLFLMAYQVMGEMAHEWTGISMTILVIVHQILNRKWYGTLFKGKYNPYRILTTVLSILLVLCFAMTAFCGMSMSGYAVPFMYGLAPVSFVRRMHLSMSHWAFVLMQGSDCICSSETECRTICSSACRLRFWTMTRPAGW